MQSRGASLAPKLALLEQYPIRFAGGLPIRTYHFDYHHYGSLQMMPSSVVDSTKRPLTNHMRCFMLHSALLQHKAKSCDYPSFPPDALGQFDKQGLIKLLTGILRMVGPSQRCYAHVIS